MEKLSNLQEILNSLILNVKAKKGQFNQFGSYKYRSGEDILEAVKAELKKDLYPNNITLISNPSIEVIADRLFVKVVTTLKVGSESVDAIGYAEHGLNKKGMDESQLTGSTCTYAKKYSLQNLFQLDESQDDMDAKDNTSTQTISNNDSKKIKRLAYEAGISIDAICTAYKIKDISSLPCSKLSQVVNRLNIKITEQEGGNADN